MAVTARAKYPGYLFITKINEGEAISEWRMNLNKPKKLAERAAKKEQKGTLKEQWAELKAKVVKLALFIYTNHNAEQYLFGRFVAVHTLNYICNSGLS